MTGTATARPPPAQLVIDVLWAFVTPADCVEHIAARITDYRIDIGVYIRARSPTDADLMALRLTERAMQAHSVLADWNIES